MGIVLCSGHRQYVKVILCFVRDEPAGIISVQNQKFINLLVL